MTFKWTPPAPSQFTIPYSQLLLFLPSYPIRSLLFRFTWNLLPLPIRLPKHPTESDDSTRIPQNATIQHPTINVRQTLSFHFCTDLRTPLHIKLHQSTGFPELPALDHIAKAAFLERMVPVILRNAPGKRKLLRTPSLYISLLFESSLADFVGRRHLVLWTSTLYPPNYVHTNSKANKSVGPDVCSLSNRFTWNIFPKKTFLSSLKLQNFQ